MKNLFIYLCLPLFLLGTAASGETMGRIPDKTLLRLKTFVGIPPQSFFVERIGGDGVSVEVLVGPGRDPHTFEPTPKQMMALTQADLYFGIGFPFEEQILKKVQGSNPNFVMINTDSGIQRRVLGEQGHAEYEVRNRGEPDPHIWLGISEIKIQSKNIFKGLAEADPNNIEIYRRNLDAFLQDLDTVHEHLKERFAPYWGRPFFVFHPDFGYFADTYGLLQIPIEIGGKSPTPKQIEMLISEAKKEGVKIIFAEPQFDRRSAETVAQAIGGVVVTIDPLEKDVLNNLENIAKNIKNALK